VALPDDGARHGYVERDYLHCDILAVLVVFKWCLKAKRTGRSACATERLETSLPAIQHRRAVDAIRLQII